MLGIKINNTFLDLPSDIGLELQRNNPYLSDDEIPGEFSLGLTIRYSDNNYNILSFAGNWTKKHTKISVDAQLYDNGLFRYAGKLVLTQHTGNMNRIEETIWTGFFTIGAASFMQEIQDVRLQDINLGGIRTFSWTSFDPTDGSGGFWQHIHAATTPRAFDYTFFPVYNIGWSPTYLVQWMNRWNQSTGEFYQVPANGTSLNMLNANAITIAPQIYLDYILKQIMAQYGWKLDGDVITDAGYLAATMQSFQAIRWIEFYRAVTGHYYYTAGADVSFDLADHVPQDVTVGNLLNNLKTRFGWYFDFDSDKKIAYLRSNKSLITSPVKDWTKYALSQYTGDYIEDNKVYSLINNVDSADALPLLPKIDYNTLTSVADKASLPTADATNDGKVIYALLENVFFQSTFSGGVYSWEVYAHNIGDYEPANSNAEIESDISTMPIYSLDYGGSHYGLFPMCNQAGNHYGNNTTTPWGMRILFYHGMQPDSLGDDYPYGSCTNMNIAGTKLLPWSIPYKHQYGTTNDGSYDYWWREWLKLHSIQDHRTMSFQLPITEMKKFSFNDQIVVNNVFFLVKEMKEVLPYRSIVEAKLKRIY